MEEKKKRKEEMINQARIEAQQEWVEIYKPSMELLSQLHADIMFLVREKLARMKQSKTTPQAGELAKLWEMIKIEKGEPTKYEKSDQTHSHSFTSIDINDLSIQETIGKSNA